MGRKTIILTAVIAVAVYMWLNRAPPKLPDVNLEEWWGPSELKKDDSVRPFKITFSKEMIKDLRLRLKNRRNPPPPLEGVGFRYGFNTTYLQGILDFWRDSYNFQEREQFLNRFPQYKTQIQGLDIHFLHVKPANPGSKTVLPVLLMPGWPGSVREYYEMIPLLTDDTGKNFVFEVVVPSLPGFGFSDGAARPGCGIFEMSTIMRNLMHRLGHKQFYIQSGNWGAVIGSIMATAFPDEVLGLHDNGLALTSLSVNMKMFFGSLFPSLVVDNKYADRMYPYFEKQFAFLMEEMGYCHLHATKPETIGVALADSPAGLAAWILEKFSTWTNHDARDSTDGGLSKFRLADLLDNVMIYWSSNSYTSAVRIYAESLNVRTTLMDLDSIPTSVPFWSLRARYELQHQPDGLLSSKFLNLVGSTDLDEGGHFTAFEMPQVLAADLVKAVEQFRKFYAEKM